MTESLRAFVACKLSHNEESMSCLVTGVTGLIGRYLVKELLAQRPETTVFALVRPHSLGKLEELRGWWGSAATRVIAVTGDVQLAGLGVRAADHEHLHQCIEHVFHLAALYDLEASEADL